MDYLYYNTHFSFTDKNDIMPGTHMP